jgi:hypothetical protein
LDLARSFAGVLSPIFLFQACLCGCDPSLKTMAPMRLAGAAIGD